MTTTNSTSTARMPASKALEVLRLVRGDETGPETVAEDDWRLALDAALHALARAAKIEALEPGDMLFYFGTASGQPPDEVVSDARHRAQEGWEHAP